MLHLLLSSVTARNFALFEGNIGSATEYELNPNISVEINKSVCPCAVNSYACTPYCCCDPLCTGFYDENSDQCLPEPDKNLVQMCNEISKDSVGSVSNWFLRTILCVYRENNPLTKRGEVYSGPTNKAPTSTNTIENMLSSTSSPEPSTTLINVPSDKKYKGYHFGQNLLDANGNDVYLTYQNTKKHNLIFGTNFETMFEESIIDNKIVSISDNVLVSPGLTEIAYRPNSTVFCIIPEVTTSGSQRTHRYFTFSVNIFYRAVGYIETPQYVINSTECTVRSSPLDTATSPGQRECHSTLSVRYIEIPNNVNLMGGRSSSSDGGWLPFRLNGVN